MGLLPRDGVTLLAEGTQIVADEHFEIPVEMLGHVTSSYRSAALDRPFALALVRAGRQRIGGRLYAATRAGTAEVLVTDPALYDKEGQRRDG